MVRDLIDIYATETWSDRNGGQRNSKNFGVAGGNGESRLHRAHTQLALHQGQKNSTSHHCSGPDLNVPA